MANNPAGVNDLNRVAGPGYGNVKRQQELTREAPISGAPTAGRALNTPQRSQRQATRPQPQQAAAGPPPPEAPQPSYQAQLAAIWNELAQIPGASPLVQQYAQEAQVG